MKYHWISVRTVKIQTTGNTECWWGCKATRTLIIAGGNKKMVQPFWKTVCQFLTKLHIFLRYNPAILLLGMYTKELKTYVHTKSCTQVFIVKVKVSQSCPTLLPHVLYSPWNSPGQNTGMGSLSLFQRIFPTEGSNPGLPHCGQILYPLSHKGSPVFIVAIFIIVRLPTWLSG